MNLIRQAHEIGAKCFVFTGGEPLLARDLGMTPIVATNATLITSDHVKTFMENRTSIAINLPTLIEEKYARFTGAPSSFKEDNCFEYST